MQIGQQSAARGVEASKKPLRQHTRMCDINTEFHIEPDIVTDGTSARAVEIMGQGGQSRQAAGVSQSPVTTRGSSPFRS